MKSWKTTGGQRRAAALVQLACFIPLLALAIQSEGDSPLPDDPLQGRILFESKSCIQCHGIGGKGPSIGPSLGEGRFQGTFLDLGAALWNHVPAMSVSFDSARLPWPQLTGNEAAELMVFLYFIDYLGRPGGAADGRAFFEGRGCASCHNIGSGPAKPGPALVELRRFASPLHVAQEIWNHGPSMFERMRQMDVAAPRFEPGDLADLSAYIRQEAGSGNHQALLSVPGNPNRGRGLFAAKGCSICHGRNGRGSGGGPDLKTFELRRSAEAIAGTMWNHALKMDDAMRMRGIGWPTFQDAELADLVAFLYFLPFLDPPGDPQRGSQVFSQRSCAECHGSSGEMDPAAAASRAPPLAGREAVKSPAALVAAMWNHSPLMREAILGQGRPWPELTGGDLRDLRAYLAQKKED